MQVAHKLKDVFIQNICGRRGCGTLDSASWKCWLLKTIFQRRKRAQSSGPQYWGPQRHTLHCGRASLPGSFVGMSDLLTTPCVCCTTAGFKDQRTHIPTPLLLVTLSPRGALCSAQSQVLDAGSQGGQCSPSTLQPPLEGVHGLAP